MVTKSPSNTEEEAVVESVTEDSWMPSNIFDPGPSIQIEKQVGTDASSAEANWDADSSPLFKALRDFIFQSGEDELEAEEHNTEETTEAIVRIIEKGLIEATTMFLNPSDEQLTSPNPRSNSISITKIENEAPATFADRIGSNMAEQSDSQTNGLISIGNITKACSSCYNELQTCVQQCFVSYNCHDVQRKSKLFKKF